MASKKNLKNQVRALEALAGLTELDETAAQGVNGGLKLAPVKPAPKIKKGTGAIAVRRGTGAIPSIIGGTGALRIKGTGAIAKPWPGA